MQFCQEGVQNLVNAIYKQAADDYMKALIQNKEKQIKKIETFLLSGAYLLDEDNRKGAYLVERCREEVKIAVKFINNFLESDCKKVEVDKTAVSPNVLRIAVYNCFKTLRTQTDNNKFYLIKKKKKNNCH